MPAALPGRSASLWIETTPSPDHRPLEGGAHVDVAIIGGGIAGIIAAHLLKEAGKTVAIIDAGKIVQGITGYTTAKISSLHSLIYTELMKLHGEEGARLYGEANEAGLRFIADLVDERQIDCDFERQPNYTYTEEASELDSIKEEVQAAQALGLPASFVTDTDLPYPVVGAVRFEDQAQFHPRRFLLNLAETIPGDGSYIFEDTRATGLDEGSVCKIPTDRGTVEARDVFVATGLPFLDRGFFFAKAHPHRSYIVSAFASEAESFNGMYISVGGSTRSIRTALFEGRRIFLIGGEGHKTGQELEPGERYRRLEAFARDRFSDVELVHRWSTQDYISIDKVPYIGRLRRTTDNVHVATGFGKWGMAHGAVAGMMVSDAILGRPNRFARLYDAKRLKPFASSKEFTLENANVAQHFFGDRVSHPQSVGPDDLAPGEGAIVRVGTQRAAAYRDDEGALHTFSHVCTHLGCHVRWNAAEKSFDCPCHGSRFDTSGRVIQGPAVRDLEPKDIS